MKIMIVGSSGYIGRHVVKSLAAQGAEVVAFDLVPARRHGRCRACRSSKAT